jgi:hypothetical protein
MTVFAVKSQITSTKFQTISKSQIQMTKTTTRLDIATWNLLGICDFGFVIYLVSRWKYPCTDRCGVDRCECLRSFYFNE